jgi:hypothetical protein
VPPHPSRPNTCLDTATKTTTKLLITANVIPSSLIISILMIEALRFSETSVLRRATRCHFPADGILQSHRSENLKSYIALTGWAL